jgi:hypothetical protein
MAFIWKKKKHIKIREEKKKDKGNTMRDLFAGDAVIVLVF